MNPPPSPKKKDAVIGVAAKYSFRELLPWVRSIKETGFSGDVILILLNAPEALVRAVTAEGVIAVPMPIEPHAPVYAERYLHVYDYLKKHDNYRFVVFVDTRDAIFQRDPSAWMEKHFAPSGKKLLVSAESILLENEPTNVRWAHDYFGPYFFNLIRSQPVLNGGVIAGYAPEVRGLCLMVFEMMLRAPNIGADQIAYNILLALEPWASSAMITRLEEGWTLNAQVTSSPKHKQLYEPFLLDPRPVFDGERVVNARGVPFVIVHQYDRVSQWNDAIGKKYANKTPDAVIGSGAKQSTLWLGKAESLYYQGRAPEAAAIMRRLSAEDPHNQNYKIVLAYYTRAIGSFDESDALLGDSSPHTPGFAKLEGFRHLREGRFLEGMRARGSELDIYRAHDIYPLPKEKAYKKGMPVEGKTILLALEGGNGDEIAYARFAKVLADRGAHVIAGTMRGFSGVIGRVKGVVSARYIGDIAPHEYDYYIPAMDVVSLFDVTHPSAGIEHPYLVPDPAWNILIEPVMAVCPIGATKIGIHWAGNPQFSHHEFKSFPPELLTRFSKLGQLFSFQLPETDLVRQFLKSPAGAAVIDIHHHDPSWEKTVAAVAAMDYIITADTAIAHIAGALGKKAFVIVPHAPSVYWADLKQTSIWYPSITVCRQPAYGNWEGAIARAYALLAAEK